MLITLLETTQILNSPSSHPKQPDNICLHKDSDSIIPESGIRECQAKGNEHSLQLAAGPPMRQPVPWQSLLVFTRLIVAVQPCL